MRFLRHGLLASIAFLLGYPSSAVIAESRDALSAQVELDDAERFAKLFNETNGEPTAEQLQERYLDAGGRALEIFTPGRIVDAHNLAISIAENKNAYRDAIERCLPLVQHTQDDLRSIYLSFRGLLPERPLPRIAVVFGGANSGGTAGPDMQVLGLEVLCEIAPDEAAFRELMRTFYAHETVHTLQRYDGPKVDADPMLTAAISEGTADYLALLVTGKVPDFDRNAWASERRAFVLGEFAVDLATARDRGLDSETRDTAFYRWFANAGSAPEGWPSELGYWVGMQIASGYVENARDPHAAIRRLLTFEDPAEILAQSGVPLLQLATPAS